MQDSCVGATQMEGCTWVFDESSAPRCGLGGGWIFAEMLFVRALARITNSSVSSSSSLLIGGGSTSEEASSAGLDCISCDEGDATVNHRRPLPKQ